MRSNLQTRRPHLFLYPLQNGRSTLYIVYNLNLTPFLLTIHYRPLNPTVMLLLLTELSLTSRLSLICHLPQLLLAHIMKVTLPLHLSPVQMSHPMKVPRHLVKKVIHLLVLVRSSVRGAPQMTCASGPLLRMAMPSSLRGGSVP